MEEEQVEIGTTKLITEDDKKEVKTDNINVEEEFLKPSDLLYEEE